MSLPDVRKFHKIYGILQFEQGNIISEETLAFNVKILRVISDVYRFGGKGSSFSELINIMFTWKEINQQPLSISFLTFLPHLRQW